MKALRSLVVLFVLFSVASDPCLALQLNSDVSPELAKTLGIAIRTNPDGENGVKVWLEFATQGPLKNFTRVDLQIDAGGKRLVTAPLLDSRPSPDKITVSFSADPALLSTSLLTIVVGNSPRTRIGYELKVKDFLTKELAR